MKYSDNGIKNKKKVKRIKEGYFYYPEKQSVFCQLAKACFIEEYDSFR